ncbi:hypothetical protein PHMEG_0004193 [Phytophthora megakarya]|uniref:Uncharacterized protein n=1 Tax=Phytophthora megakarya TaxID=4795 RepID=A0A225WUI3_9STRA|nr:hypothetical protein PHMEG_0004193 [Phytophthora megakarya]
MIKRFTALTLLVLVAVLSCVHADDAPAPAPPAKDDQEQASPPGVTVLGREPVPTTHEQMEQWYGGGGGGFIPTGGIQYRWRFTFPYGGGYRYGYRYPIGWWNSFGRRFYGGRCLFGRPWGGFYYC